MNSNLFQKLYFGLLIGAVISIIIFFPKEDDILEKDYCKESEFGILINDNCNQLWVFNNNTKNFSFDINEKHRFSSDSYIGKSSFQTGNIICEPFDGKLRCIPEKAWKYYYEAELKVFNYTFLGVFSSDSEINTTQKPTYVSLRKCSGGCSPYYIHDYELSAWKWTE